MKRHSRSPHLTKWFHPRMYGSPEDIFGTVDNVRIADKAETVDKVGTVTSLAH